MLTVQTIPTLTSGAAATKAVALSDLSADQRSVYDDIVSWYHDSSRSRKPYLTLGGLAGTGKSTLISVLAAQSSKSVIAACAYTGKASSVLNQKLNAAGLKPRRFLVATNDGKGADVPEPGISCSTIHSLIYMAVTDEKTGRVIEWKLKPDLPASLIIVDEASMVGSEMWKDLCSYGVPILAVGDHGQLPPIGAGNVNLMKDPDLRLERIHRQAEGNPIIRLAHHIRDGKGMSTFRTDPGDHRVSFAKSIKHIIDEFGAGSLDRAILCGYNRSRVGYNQMIRAHRGFEGPFPDPGDLVICLKNHRPIFNGMRGIVVAADLSERKPPDPFCRFPMTVDFPYDGMRVSGAVQSAQFGEEKTISEFRQVNVLPGKQASVKTWADVGLLYDYGYAMTVHKAQGSQFEKVALVAEPFGTEDEKVRWIYTGVTRASEQLFVVSR